MSKVMTDGAGKIKFPINEPAERQAQEPDRGVPRLLRRARRAAHRADLERHRRHRRGAEAARRGLPRRRPTRTTTDVADRVGEIDEDYDDLRRLRDPRRPRRRRLPAADLHEDRAGPADAVLRGDRAPRRARLRRGELQGAVRGDRARAGPPRESPQSSASGARPRCSSIRQRAGRSPRDRPPPVAAAGARVAHGPDLARLAVRALAGRAGEALRAHLPTGSRSTRFEGRA